MRARFALVLTLATAPAWSCNCGPRPIDEEFAESTAVFMATVLSNDFGKHRSTLPKWRASLEVEKTWKTDGKDLRVLIAEAEGATCGIHLVPGVQYIIFALRGTDGPLTTTSCSRTIPTSYPYGCSTYKRACDLHRMRLEEISVFLQQHDALKPNNALEWSGDLAPIKWTF